MEDATYFHAKSLTKDGNKTSVHLEQGKSMFDTELIEWLIGRDIEFLIEKGELQIVIRVNGEVCATMQFTKEFVAAYGTIKVKAMIWEELQSW